jgi:hypothetical protein
LGVANLDNQTWDKGYDWTFKYYLDGITKFKKSGYDVNTFSYIIENEPDKYLILRHDVDFNFDSAYQMAEFENQNGISATYFFRVHAAGYNLFSVQNVRKLHEMRDMGHEIGLHVDHGLDFYLSDEISNANFQLNSFENLTGINVKGFSSHEPARFGGVAMANDILKNSGCSYHAYEDRFFTEIKYLSDSTKRWREEPFDHYVDVLPKLQVLFHPIWWHMNIPQEGY